MCSDRGYVCGLCVGRSLRYDPEGVSLAVFPILPPFLMLMWCQGFIRYGGCPGTRGLLISIFQLLT